ncbi:MarR family transcriptional regulator [Gemmobacter sp.]|uniref:MarR family winged helix-turn-helix transcriptional regulator n=1 Tax=Gemmobacter sp. TaxID=1898957 RepID=UPI002AFED60D|nr:MarR family transcriptional regulator [Gemmobacter sp.]
MNQTSQNGGSHDFRIDNYPILRMARIVSAVQERIVSGVTSYPLVAPSWRVLALLADRGPMTVKMLAVAALIERSSLSRTIMRMEDDGLLERAANPHDGRSTLLRLSDKGQALFDESQPVAIAAMHAATDALSGAELEKLFEMLDRMMASLQSASDADPPN